MLVSKTGTKNGEVRCCAGDGGVEAGETHSCRRLLVGDSDAASRRSGRDSRRFLRGFE